MHPRPVIAAALLLAPPAFAKTPDGATPAVEDVCDEYSGAAYGLCNSYCEAMDCDHDAVRAADAACTSVARQFEKKTGRALSCGCTVTVNPDERTVFLNEMPQQISVLANDNATGGRLTFAGARIPPSDPPVATLDDATKGEFTVHFGTYIPYDACCTTDDGDSNCGSSYISVTVLSEC